MSYVYNKIYEDVLNYYENYGFDTQEEAEEKLEQSKKKNNQRLIKVCKRL